VDVFSILHNHYDNIYLLESVEGPKKLAEYSFIGFNPSTIIEIKDKKVHVKGEADLPDLSDEPFEALRQIYKNIKLQRGFLRLTGGLVGYVSYDSIRYCEKLPTNTTDELKLPDIEMGAFNDGIAFNHLKKESYYYYLQEDRFDEFRSFLEKRFERDEGDFNYTKPKSSISKEGFMDGVLKAKEYITDGDIFQVVLSRRYNFEVKGDLIHFYRALREINPSPYMYYLKLGGKEVVGSSPEMLVRVENCLVETYPIAGTRPRSNDPVKNRALAKDLLSDPKERAEHIMLVDLARNDVGKVSDYGSVSVPEFMKVYEYSHVQHIVSRVVGKLSNECDCFDVLKAVMPAGTVSGAPKVRAMEIIEEIEPTRRGPYAGGVGYFSYNGKSDFAITIRTLVSEGKKSHIQVGAGIVADSNPENEWYETQFKAEALMKALNEAVIRTESIID
jgi:anthranilate synthase component 1